METAESEDKAIDLSGKGLKKLTRNFVTDRMSVCSELNLNRNDLQKLEFLTGLQCIEKFSAAHNLLLRMYNIQTFKNLVHLDLSFNKIICIEGLREMPNLHFINLSHNKIKEIDNNFQKNFKLDHIDLSDNIISNIANLSHLSKLKTLLLHGNLIATLKTAEFYFPKSLEKLTLAQNKISDLNEVRYLVELTNLKELTIMNNPCLESTGQSIGVEYRPFLVNWCQSLKVIDGYALNDMESLKGEWLFSQGKGRKFRPGEHKELIQYLSENIPFTGDHLDSEQDRKLRLVLSKAREHKSPLNPQLSSGRLVGRTPQIMSRSLDPSALGKSSDSKTSYGASTLSRSLHCTSLPSEKDLTPDNVAAPLPAASKLVPVPESLVSPMVATIPEIPPLQSKDSSVPKDVSLDTSSTEMPSTTKLIQPAEEVLPAAVDKVKLQAIKSIAEEIKGKKIDRGMAPERSSTSSLENKKPGARSIAASSSLSGSSTAHPTFKAELAEAHFEQSETSVGDAKDVFVKEAAVKSVVLNLVDQLEKDFARAAIAKNRESAATKIQKVWRGYFCRSQLLKAVPLVHSIELQRVHKHVVKLSSDVEAVKVAVENEHKVHVLQIQAINGLWRKLNAMQGQGDEPLEMRDLSETCERLNLQVQQLQLYMQNFMKCVGRCTSPVGSSVSTQTDVIAVHTPQLDDSTSFLNRPSTLSLSTQENITVSSLKDTVIAPAEESDSE